MEWHVTFTKRYIAWSIKTLVKVDLHVLISASFQLLQDSDHRLRQKSYLGVVDTSSNYSNSVPRQSSISIHYVIEKAMSSSMILIFWENKFDKNTHTITATLQNNIISANVDKFAGIIYSEKKYLFTENIK